MDPIKRKKLENAFYNYDQNRRKANINLGEIIPCVGAIDYSKLVVQSTKSNIMEGNVVKAIDEKETAFKLFKIVDNVLIKYKDDYRFKLIDCLYFKRLCPNQVVRRLKIDRATLFRWKNEILLSAEFWAHELKYF